MGPTRHLRLLVLALFALLVAPAVALADHPQPARDIAELGYAPEGFFKAGDPVPMGNACKESELFTAKVEGKRRFNPSGNYNAFDNNEIGRAHV